MEPEPAPVSYASDYGVEPVMDAVSQYDANADASSAGGTTTASYASDYGDKPAMDATPLEGNEPPPRPNPGTHLPGAGCVNSVKFLAYLH